MIINGSNLTDVGAVLELLNASGFAALTKGQLWQISELWIQILESTNQSQLARRHLEVLPACTNARGADTHATVSEYYFC